MSYLFTDDHLENSLFMEVNYKNIPKIWQIFRPHLSIYDLDFFLAADVYISISLDIMLQSFYKLVPTAMSYY